MRAVITGASGHLGSFVANMAARAGHSVLAVVRPESDLWRLDQSLSGLELLRLGLLTEIEHSPVPDPPPDVLIHAAWAGVTRDQRNSSEAVKLNVDGALATLEFARQAGCRTWIGIGSQAEYGLYDRPLSEDAPCDPTSLYGAAKLAVYHLAKTFCQLHGIRFIWFRLYSTYGPFDDPRRLIPSVIERLLAQEKPALTGGEQVWDYLYVSDAAEAILEAAEREQISGLFNLGSGEAVLIRQAVEMVRDLIDPNLPLGFGAVPYGAGQPMFLQANIAKWLGVAQWRPRTRLDEGLRETVAWHQSRKHV